MTGKFDPDDRRHCAIKQELMHGIALKDIATMGEVNRTLEAAGFEIIEARDLAGENDGSTLPWYQPLDTRHGTLGKAVGRIPLGRKVWIGASKLAEIVGMFPKGSADVVRLLDRTANAYVAGGKTGVFTPLYCFLARKPL